MWKSHEFRQKFLWAVAIKQGGEVLDFLLEDVKREVNSVYEVYANAEHYTMQSFQDEHGMPITGAAVGEHQKSNAQAC